MPTDIDCQVTLRRSRLAIRYRGGQFDGTEQFLCRLGVLAEKDNDLARTAVRPPKIVVIVGADCLGETECCSQQIDGSSFPVVARKNRALCLICGWKTVIHTRDCHGHSVPT